MTGRVRCGVVAGLDLVVSTKDTSWAMRGVREARAAVDTFAADAENIAKIERVSALLAERFRVGGKVLICGNGGSSADAMHFAEELTGRFRKDRRALPAIACTDTGHITCAANDFGFEHVFSRWVEALGREGDVLIVLSTSGNSRNIIEAIKAGHHAKMHTVALLGKGGGALKGACGHEWIIAGDVADRIQEIHMIILHALVEGVERILFPENYSG